MYGADVCPGFAQKRLKKQPTLLWLREEIGKELEQVQHAHDEAIIRPIYNSLEEYTTGSCDMLAHPTNIEFQNRLVGFGMCNVPENNWEAVMDTVLHYLSTRMDYNKKLQKATHLVVDEAQVVSENRDLQICSTMQLLPSESSEESSPLLCRTWWQLWPTKDGRAIPELFL